MAWATFTFLAHVLDDVAVHWNQAGQDACYSNSLAARIQVHWDEILRLSLHVVAFQERNSASAPWERLLFCAATTGHELGIVHLGASTPKWDYGVEA